MKNTEDQKRPHSPMSRSYRVQDTIPVGPDLAINTLPPLNDDVRDNGAVPGTWDNQRDQWVPYRGNVDHGVAFSTETVAYDGPLQDGLGGTTQESLVVLPTPSKPDIEPVPVRIVDTTVPSDERHQFRTNVFPIANTASPVPARIIGANPRRTKVTFKVIATGTDSVLIGNSEKVDPLLGWPLANGQLHSLTTTEQVFVTIPPANAALVTVYVIEEWTQTVKPE